MNHNVSKEMQIAGNELAAELMAATFAKSIESNWDNFVSEYKGDNLDLIKAYIAEEIDSVTAIYIAMERSS